MTHLMRIAVHCNAAFDERRHPLRLGPRAAGDQHERPIAGRPDGRFMTEHLDQLLRPHALRQHEDRDGPPPIAVHQMRDLALPIETAARTDQLEARGVELLRQMQLPAERRHHRALDGRRRIVRAQHAVRGETLHVVRGELRGQHSRRVMGRLIQERAGDEQHQARRERERGNPDAPRRSMRQAPAARCGRRTPAPAALRCGRGRGVARQRRGTGCAGSPTRARRSGPAFAHA